VKFFEYEAKEVFKAYGIPTPEGRVAFTPAEAREIAAELNKPVAIKVQVLVGGRGKAGGIRFANTPEEAEKIAANLLGSTFKGLKVDAVLVEEKLSIGREFYLGITIDRAAKRLVAIASAKGGVDIEEIARQYPNLIVKEHIDPLVGFYPFMARRMLKALNFEGSLLTAMSQIMKKLYDIAIDYDAELVEINPLVLTEDGRLMAADAKLNVDSDALFRHPNIKSKAISHEISSIEAEAKAAGLSYVELNGDIGIIGNGAGLVMTTLDLVKIYGGSPANFLDVGGGAEEKVIATALKILINHPRVKVILVNIFGGITRCDVVARGIVSALKSIEKRKPIVIRLIGTNDAEGRAILENEGLLALSSMEEAAKAAVDAARREV